MGDDEAASLLFEHLSCFLKNTPCFKKLSFFYILGSWGLKQKYQCLQFWMFHLFFFSLVQKHLYFSAAEAVRAVTNTRHI